MAESKYFEKSDRKSHKFYEVIIDGSEVIITYGRIGYNGKSVSKTFSSEEEARNFRENMIKKKLRKGYLPAEKGKTLPKLRPAHPGQLRLPF